MNERFDPELQYCPQCHDEYRAGIPSCAACGIGLLSGQEMRDRHNKDTEQRGARSRDIAPDEGVVTVRKGPVQQIKALQAYLLRQGIPSLAVKESGAACGCRGGALALQIRETDLAEAMAALEQEYRESTGVAEHDTRFCDAVFDADVAEAVCPACGCRFSTRLTVCPDCGLCFA